MLLILHFIQKEESVTDSYCQRERKKEMALILMPPKPLKSIIVLLVVLFCNTLVFFPPQLENFITIQDCVVQCQKKIIS